MSELLKLAKQLRLLSDSQLCALIRRRLLATKPKDFIDLSQQLLTSRSIELCFATLTAKELAGLKTAKPEQLEMLLTTGLVYRDENNYFVIDAVALKLAELPVSEPKPASEVEPDLPDSGPLAAIAVFETQQAITELLLDIEQRLVRVVNRGSVGLPDIKNLAQQLHKTHEFARACYQIADRLGLITAKDSRWWLTSSAKKWLSSEPSERWLILVKDWFATLGQQATEELAECYLRAPNSGLREVLSQVFPLADKNLTDLLAELSHQAEWFGLAVSSRPTAALTALLENDEARALESLVKFLPKPQNRLLAQGDLSLVAPGPLPTEVEILVRTFTDLEQVSIASTYRISVASVTYALECGLTESEIRDTLQNLTKAPLPQPIDYLINQASVRFGRIKIAASSGLERSLVQASDLVLLSEILNDQRLRPFAFHPVTANTLASRFEPEVIYYGLREHGYLAVRVDAEGLVLSPQVSTSWHQEGSSNATDAAGEIVTELRNADARLGENPNDEDLLRQVQLAIKNRATLRVHLTLRDGTSHTYDLRVSGLANGRLRGLDAKANAERVLPLSQITRVEF